MSYKAVLFDFSDVVGTMRMALAGEPGVGPYRIDLIEDVTEAIYRLRATGMRTALVTNNDREGFAEHAPHIDLSELFDVVVFSSDVGAAKPSFKIFAHTLKELGIDAHEAFFIDDVPANVDAAAAMGIAAVVADSTATTISSIEQIIASQT